VLRRATLKLDLQTNASNSDDDDFFLLNSSVRGSIFRQSDMRLFLELRETATVALCQAHAPKSSAKLSRPMEMIEESNDACTQERECVKVSQEHFQFKY
jgi:hypothetical protein